MRLMGVDPGLSATGYACVASNGPAREPTLVEAGVIRLRQRTSVADRLVELERDVADAIARLEPDAIAIEALFSHYKRPRTAIVMGHARGVILLASARAGLAIREVAPTAVKRSLTGNGHASKAQVQRAVQAQLGLAEPPSPHDVADAIAIALTAARREAVSATVA